ncbi:hypothetical protein F5884DRAFT_3127 [Xylogone sp. PMI_703]|nr:hypothetical protein F5884DRAFT_3127 [Xylogone sp. PMI_703]
MEAAQGLSNLSKETNEAWQTFLTLFARDCAQEGHAKASGLLPGRLQFLVDKISEASNSPGTILGPSLFGQLGAVGTNTSASNVGGSIKEEISEESVSSMRFFGTSRNELVSQTGLGWEGEGIRSEENYASGWSLNKGGFSAHNSTLGSSDPVMGKGHSIGPSGMLKPLRPKSAGKEVVKGEALENQKPLKNKMINFSTSDMRSNGSLQELPNSFQQLLGLSDLENKGKDQLLSLEEVHGIVSFVNLVASPHALSQFRQAIIGWRSQGETTELMQATQFVSVLRALNHLEAQSTFSAIATRIKLVQLAEAVDVANITFPSPRGRGNPLVKWLSAQYRQFLHLEYPELKVGSRPWNTKLDDLKRKVKAGRRWQQLISRFGVGIIGLVPVFTPGDQRNIDFNRLIKTNSELCFKLMIKTLERDKCDHIRSMSIKLEEFMLSLFKGNKDPPRLILEGVDPSNIEAQPIDSPQLVTYLDPANPDSIISPVPYGFSSSNAQAVGAHVDLTNGNRLENANPRDSKLERYVPNRGLKGWRHKLTACV